MENTNESFFKPNTLFGGLIGGSFIIASLLFAYAGKGVVANPQFNNIIMMLTIFGVFIGIKKYRDDHLAGIISYGKALSTGIYILAVAAVCYAVYTFILYSSDSELLATYKKVMLTMMNEVYKNMNLQELFNTSLSDLFFSPVVIAFGELFNRILVGAAFTLFIAGLVKRKTPPFNPQQF
ncbi:DUF4199 domain-containing protein [Butyricimonas hominis]|jgi:hypothetical protein|uniref:DUF4199 domain-containing protein n=1 Tax=Butyricimonas hominis TaxID=2763032 RepID=A0ABR7D543_9BACT|nr:DUF4199 domain-containing protein [Butyricimonas hominis]MBC5623087.1 DUF4199 domain-containing protein [Butyricimonas hominis]